MPQQLDRTDLRRAPEATLLDALADANPLALAEAYHRTVPAAHAIARRLITGADAVEDLLLDVYTEVWHSPPTDGPLEGWVRRQTWQRAVDQLRERGVAPASPSAAGLLPDLPAPEVRFLDAAERAIAELPDDERRAVLLAHDSGVPSPDQGDGAADSLARALMSLAGPETSTNDRAALHEDGCDDVTGIGDWCLGLAEDPVQDEVSEAIRSRPGCAAKSRAVRRGRRRIEGLPATADMGQRILVTVLTAGDQPAVPTAPAPIASDASPVEPVPDIPVPQDVGPEPVADEELGETGPLPRLEDLVVAEDRVVAEDPVVAGGMDVDDGMDAADGEDDPFRPLDDGSEARVLVEDTADLPQMDVGSDDDVDSDTGAAAPRLVPAKGSDVVDDTALFGGPDADDELTTEQTVPADDQDWRPDPGSTAELRLSDILAEGEDDDDPFADMDDLDDDVGPVTTPGDPYAALQHLEGTEEPPPPARVVPVASDDEVLVDGYVEGQDDYGMPADRRSITVAQVLSWVLPILGGSIIGITVAILFFGLPG